jgi:hypothetical protein
MTDPRELAQDFLDTSEDYEVQTLARELLKALDGRDWWAKSREYWRERAVKTEIERDRLRTNRDYEREIARKNAETAARLRAERDEALRSIGEETKLYIEELEAERDRAEAERDRLREALGGPIRDALLEIGREVNREHAERVNLNEIIVQVGNGIAATRAVLAELEEHEEILER